MSALPIAITINVGFSSWSPTPAAMSRSTSAAASTAVTAEVDESGPAIANGSEPRMATTNAAIAVETNVAATP
ncbi:MAG: hypothetical protein WCD83_07760 [Pseudolabrys sp.]